MRQLRLLLRHLGRILDLCGLLIWCVQGGAHVQRVHQPCQLASLLVGVALDTQLVIDHPEARSLARLQLGLQGRNLRLLVHEDRAHDLELLVFDSILFIQTLNVFGEHADAFFQYLVVENHLMLLARRHFRILTCSRTSRRRASCPIAPCGRTLGLRRASVVSASIVLRAKLQHVLMHELLGLIDVLGLRINTSYESF